MKIYTKTGDDGQTSLYGGAKVPKNHIRLEAYGTIDELNAFIGQLIAQIQSKSIFEELNSIQNSLFNVGTELATPKEDLYLENGKLRFAYAINNSEVEHLEKKIDSMEQELNELKNFILPQGSAEIASTHIARTVCRRAERVIVALNEYEKLRPELLQYINRLSDYFFVLARYIAHLEGKADVIWKSHKDE